MAVIFKDFFVNAPSSSKQEFLEIAIFLRFIAFYMLRHSKQLGHPKGAEIGKSGLVNGVLTTMIP